MKKFTIKIALTLICLYCILTAIQLLIDHTLSKDTICQNNTWHKIFSKKLTTDIAIIGTSRAESHYDTEIISKITGLKTYNLGISGTHYNILKIRWDSYFNRNQKPQLLIIDVDASSLRPSKEIYEKFQYLPFSDVSEYRDVAQNIDPDFYLEKLIPLYKYRGNEMNIYKRIKALNNPLYCNKSINGYVEHDIKWIEKDYEKLKQIIKTNKKNKSINNPKKYSEGLKIIEQIITDCKKENIPVHLIWSPSYHESIKLNFNEKKYINQKLLEYARAEGIYYNNFTQDTICLNKNNFYNTSHLNKTGVSIFSNKIAKILNDQLTKVNESN